MKIHPVGIEFRADRWVDVTRLVGAQRLVDALHCCQTRVITELLSESLFSLNVDSILGENLWIISVGFNTIDVK